MTLTKSLPKLRGLLLIVLIVASSFALINMDSYIRQADAQSAECPPDMSLEACLDYLRGIAEEIENERDQVTEQINEEQYKQLSLYEKLNYFNGLISDSQSKIDALEVSIEKNNVELNILSNEIEILENNINTAEQEINNVQNSINQRISFSYKATFYSPLELLLNANEMDGLIQRIQYLRKTRVRDQELLSDMSIKIADLNREQELLNGKKLEVQEKQIELEDNKTELFAEKTKIDDLRAEQAILVAESERKEAEFRASLQQLSSIESQVAQQITQVIFELYQQGQIPANTPVNKGDIIGFQGHTGLSAGSHLHFVYTRNGAYTYPFSSGLLSGGGLWQAVGSGSGHAPVDGGILTQTAHAGQNAIDIQSQNDYGYNGQTYRGGVCCYGYCIPDGYYSMRGEGAPVRSVKAGYVSAVNVDACGGKYVIVDHGGGETSLYLHLR